MILSRISKSFYKYKRKLPYSHNYGIKSNTVDLKVLFFGTDNFSLPSLKLLHKHTSNDCDLGVVTSLKCSSNCVRMYAEKFNLSIYKWPITADDCKLYDLGVVVSFGHLIPINVINAFPLGMINVHASLLPRWRGAAPIIHALLSGDKKTGVSIMRIEPKYFDIGNIFAQRSVNIKNDMLLTELHQRLSLIGAELLLDVIKGYPESFQNSQKQIEAEATYAPKIQPSFSIIEWSNMTAEQVFTRYRALYGYRNVVTSFAGKTVYLLDMNYPVIMSSIHYHEHEGGIVYHREHKSLIVTCSKRTYIEIKRLRLEGKKAMNAMEFNNGYLKKLQEKSNAVFLDNKNV